MLSKMALEQEQSAIEGGPVRQHAPRVLLVASEIYPLAKTGGLADVCAALPRALDGLGAEPRLMMPGYESALDQIRGVHRVTRLDDVLGVGPVRLIEGFTPDSDLPLELVDAPALFRRPGGLYQDSNGVDWGDNAKRYAVLCHVAAQRALGRIGDGWQPEVVHCHDWHTGLVPLLLKSARGPRPLSVMTIHNISFQGNFPLDLATELGLPPAVLSPEVAEFYGQLSFLKTGICAADRLTTVSPTYAREIRTAEFGCGLEGVIAARAGDLTGIMNGIDEAVWDPARDQHLEQRYSRDDLAGKTVCKQALQQRLGLDVDPDTTLLMSASRITEQKMADVLLAELPGMLNRHPRLQFALIGRGDRGLERALIELASWFPGQASVRIGYQEAEAHQLHGGADALLHGSRFEPCGLTQLYAMRYGTVPIVRQVGGLSDSVCDASDTALIEGSATGFVFANATGAEMQQAVARCVAVHQHQPECWRSLQRRAMRADFGWRRSATQYLRLYRDGCEALAAQALPAPDAAPCQSGPPDFASDLSDAA